MPGNGWGKSPPEEACRRSVYVHVKRSLLVPILSVHDQADTDSSCPVRYTTTVPTQALGMLNGEFTNQQATAFAGRLQREAPGDLAAQVEARDPPDDGAVAEGRRSDPRRGIRPRIGRSTEAERGRRPAAVLLADVERE